MKIGENAHTPSPPKTGEVEASSQHPSTGEMVWNGGTVLHMCPK